MSAIKLLRVTLYDTKTTPQVLPGGSRSIASSTALLTQVLQVSVQLSILKKCIPGLFPQRCPPALSPFALGLLSLSFSKRYANLQHCHAVKTLASSVPLR